MRAPCHDDPACLAFDGEVLESRPGRLRLARSWFFPGGGGQLADRGWVSIGGARHRITGIEEAEGAWWHLHEGPADVRGRVPVAIDGEFRRTMSQLHTALHLVNAFAYRGFEGALVTGAQMAEDRTARVDLDLPGADNDRLRALEADLNAAIAADLPVRAAYVTREQAEAEPGLLRSRSVAPPPQPDGSVRVVEIVGLDRQACGGTHVTSTGQIPPLRILKVENKGRHNRRVRIGFA